MSQTATAPELVAETIQEHCPRCQGALPAGAVEVVVSAVRRGRFGPTERHRVARAYCAHCRVGFIVIQRRTGAGWSPVRATPVEGATKTEREILANMRARAEAFGCAVA